MRAQEVPERAAFQRTEALEVGEHYLRVGIGEEVIEIFGDADVRRVADGDQLAEAQTSFTRELSKS